MQVLLPLALVLLPLAALPFLLTRRTAVRARRIVSSIALWSQPRHTTAGGPTRRTRIDLLTLLRAAALIAFVLGLARPVLTRQRSVATIVIDTSASMGAVENGRTRLDDARAAAADLQRRLPQNTDVRIFSDSDVTRVIGVAAASNPGAPIYVFSDAPAQSGPDVHWTAIGTPVANLAISGLVARRTASGDVRVDVSIGNFGPVATDVRLSVTDGSTPIELATTVGAGRIRTVSATAAMAGGTVTADIVGITDALPVDNRRTTVIADAQPVHVVMTFRDTALERAIEADPLVRLTHADGSPPRDAAVVVCSNCEASALTSPALVVGDGAPGAVASLLVTAPGHPVVSGLEGLRADVAPLTAAAGDDDVVLAAGGLPVVSVSDGRRRVVHLNADLSISRFAATAAFPVLIANSLEWLAAKPADSSGIPVTESDTWSVPSQSVRPDNALAAQVSAPLELTTVVLVGAMLLVIAEWRWCVRHRRYVRRSSRVATLALLAIAATGLKVPFGRLQETATFVVDESASVPASLRRVLAARIEAMQSPMRRGDRSAIVVFGEDAVVARQPAERAPVTRIDVVPNPSGSDIERAIDVALHTTAASTASRIVLLSDGQETTGSAVAAAQRAAKAGVSIDVVPLDGATEDALQVTTVSAPPHVRVEEPFIVRAAVAGHPGVAGTVTFATDDGRRVPVQVRLDSHGRGEAQLQERRQGRGVYAYQASADDGEDGGPGAVVLADGRPAVLYVSNGPASLNGLAASGFSLTHLVPSALATTNLRGYDLVVLEDVDASALGETAWSAVANYVREDAGGLIVLGGDRLISPGSGYSQSSLDPILPLDLQPHRGTRGSSMAYVLLVDKSGSMADQVSGVSKMELARESAMRLVNVVPGTGSLGIIAFDARPSVILPLGSARETAAIAASVRGIEPRGPTAIAPALDLASTWLGRVTAARKRVLLLSDGRTSTADAERLRAAARTHAFELSVVAIGADADEPLLRRVAAESGGRAYFPSDLSQLPRIVAGDAADTAGRTTVEEVFKAHAPEAHPIATGIAMPSFAGYAVATARPGASVVLASPLDDPILAAWTTGAGRVTMFTAGLGTAWSASFRRSPSFAQLWTQAARWTSRRAHDHELDAELFDTDEGVRVQVTAVTDDGLPAALDDPRIAVHGESADVTARLDLEGPGRYGANVHTQDLGAVTVSVDARDSITDEDLHIVRGIFRAASREHARLGANHERLSRVAAITGGRVLGPEESPFAAERPVGYRSARPAAAALALLLFTLDLILASRPRGVRIDPARTTEAA